MNDKNIKLIDFHCHLDLCPEFTSAFNEIEQSIGVVAVTTTPLAWPVNRQKAQESSNIVAALGFHPQLVKSHKADFGVFEKYIDQTSVIGEVGLDNSKNFKDSINEQEEIFETILGFCKSRPGKILSIHSLKAESKVIGKLRDFSSQATCTPVMHWFTGSMTQAKHLLDLGAYFSFNHKMLKSNKGKELISYLPKDRLLTETDFPFTTNTSSISAIYESLTSTITSSSYLLKISEYDTRRVILNNASKLLSFV
ncbi:Qat anti-phage system TatD family nuclease QatD [Colwellia ponticola]|uniref:TatD family deoxyribonuclease n=1 Tax=Colwellia ponticola TaxID=2304625 RepID=A0A8H2PM19_9GAMM|nr:Qat anti-phage system TatD family nuclease QatD [Colwellia ponticola]TMM45725.1 TatD family deoxyribonuclease [Colwellia ponticola]